MSAWCSPRPPRDSQMRRGRTARVHHATRAALSLQPSISPTLPLRCSGKGRHRSRTRRSRSTRTPASVRRVTGLGNIPVKPVATSATGAESVCGRMPRMSPAPDCVGSVWKISQTPSGDHRGMNTSRFSRNWSTAGALPSARLVHSLKEPAVTSEENVTDLPSGVHEGLTLNRPSTVNLMLGPRSSRLIQMSTYSVVALLETASDFPVWWNGWKAEVAAWPIRIDRECSAVACLPTRFRAYPVPPQSRRPVSLSLKRRDPPPRKVPAAFLR